MNYEEFIENKRHSSNEYGFDAELPEFLFPFQRDLVSWALRKGRAAIFADTGLGKTPMELVWADQVVKHTNGRVLILTPLAVSYQTVMEAEKFGIECRRISQGELRNGISATNYERLKHCDSSNYVGVVCDESSILKNSDGAYRAFITDFMKKIPYRLLATATAAPNDHHELGTSSEALGELGYMDMLNRFFKNDLNNSSTGRAYGEQMKWRFKGHAELPFWQWVTSWARAIRKPSDFGYDNGKFELPPLIEHEHEVEVQSKADGMLFNLPAVGLKEQRDERRRSITERCERVAELVNDEEQALIWCHLNPEGDLLEKLIPDAIQISGSDPEEEKEERLMAFARGEIRKLVTKPKIGCLGLNLQNCAHVTFFPSHSYEQYYQGVRRCWRYGQTKSVVVDIVTTEGEQGILKNLQRKAVQADKMFSKLVEQMNNSSRIVRSNTNTKLAEIPSWL